MPIPFRAVTLLAALAVATPVGLSSRAPAQSGSPAATIDSDSGGTVDLAEARTAASRVFLRSGGSGGDRTLGMKELGGRVEEADFRKADPDNDGTLTQEEYLALVEMRFKAADPDNDGTLDATEMKSAAGQALARLLK